MFVGIDVAKDELVIATQPDGACWRSSTTAAGLRTQATRLKRLAPERIVLEATGGLERPIAIALVDVGLPVRIVNPRQVRSFAHGVGRHPKTDPIATSGYPQVLAHFAEIVQPPVRPAAAPADRTLRALVTRRRQLREAIVTEGNQAAVALSHARILKQLESERDRIEADLARLIALNATWQAKAALLTSVPGIGTVTILTLLV